MTYIVHEERDGHRMHFMSGVSGRDLPRLARRLRESGSEPIVYGEQDGQRIWV